MNAIPPQLNPVNAVQPAASGKQQDAAADVPFSQVLSSEMAQNQRAREAKEDAQAEAGTAAAAQPGEPAEADTATTAHSAKTAKAGKDDTAADLFDPLLTDNAAAPSAVLALPVQPELKPVAAAADTGATEQATAAATDTLAALGQLTPGTAESRKGRAAAVPHPAQAGARADVQTDIQADKKVEYKGTTDIKADGKAVADTQKNDTPLPKADFQAAAATLPGTPNVHARASAGVMAAAPALQAATDRQSDAAKITERVSDLLNNPAFRPLPPAPLDAANGAPVIDNPASGRLAPQVGTTAWGQALGEKIVWMAAGAQQTASLTLNPPNLGPLQVVLHVTNDQATASFFSAQPEVRQALETAFPRLREMMNDAGIQLGQATVSADTPRQHDTPERQAPRGEPFMPFIGGRDAVSPGLQTAQGALHQSGRGLIDTFA